MKNSYFPEIRPLEGRWLSGEMFLADNKSSRQPSVVWNKLEAENIKIQHKPKES